MFSRMLGAGIGDLYLLAISPDGDPAGEPRRLTFGNRRATSPAWASGSEVVFSPRDGLWRVAVSGKAEPARLPFAAEDVRTLAISPRSHRLAFSRSMDDSNIWRVELPSGRISGPFISSTRPENRPQFSPDGRRIAFRSDRSGTSEIWVSDADGSNAVQLTSMGASVTTAPTWSPDGQRIAFHSNREGQFEVYVVGAGGGQPLRLTDHPTADTGPSWSRDGKWISFSSTRSGVPETWRIPAGPGIVPPQAVQVTRKGGGPPFESPDGKWLYYTKRGSGLWRMPVEGGEEAQILDAAAYFAVFDDGIYYLKPSGAGALLQFLDLATGRITSIASTEKPPSVGLTVSPDRRWALFSQMDQRGSDLMLVENFR